MAAEPSLPIIAIVGRPNVGKSSLFNRFAGHRRALVADQPGITRDRIAEEVEVAGRRCLIVDTAGLDPEAEGGLDEAVQHQARAAVDQADAILFVVDGQSGLLPEDETFARALRRGGKPLALAVNKIDAPVHEPRLADFHRLGLSPLRGVSAEHGRGAWDLLEELVETLPKSDAQPTVANEEGVLRIALVGRPNVGKSSLLNRFVGADRVVVSAVPGTTRDAVDIRLAHPDGDVIFVDTAGLRRPGRREPVAERASAIITLRAVERAEVALVVCDAEEGFRDQDARVVQLAIERGAAVVVVLNKWDCVEAEGDGAAARVRREVERRLRWIPDAPVVAVSARTGRGVKRIVPAARRLGEATQRRIPTAELNRWLAETVARHEPAMAQRGSRRRPLKFFYASQVASRPPTFALVCTDPDAVQASYTRFLRNQLRDRFGFEGVPVRVRLRARRRTAEE